MKASKIVDVLNAIYKWHSEGEPIAKLLELLGDDKSEVASMLVANGIADFNYKPVDGYSYQAVVNAILLYIAMREGLRQKPKK